MLGVSGGIAAYKAIEVCRRLVDAGAFVSPILTRNAERFVGATTFSALASEPVHTALWNDADPSPHTRLGQSADLIVVVPATAHVIGAYAAGLSSDLLTATLLATRAPVVVCPAMHTEMWEHPAVRANVACLIGRGVKIVDPESGHLAGGDTGVGRLAAPETIVQAAAAALDASSGDARSGDLAGLRVLITAGGTREPIDPVRFLGNRSSGKQGHALAADAAARGADVLLVTTADLATSSRVEVIRVDTAAEMHRAVAGAAPTRDVVIMAAAVADFRPVDVADEKLKKADGIPVVRLEATVDILAELGHSRTPGQTLVGFAAETGHLAEHAARKLVAKGVDLVVANDVSAPGTGFSHDTNAVLILSATGTHIDVPLADKRTIASAVLDAVLVARCGTKSDPAPSEQDIPPRSMT